jgi:hypothetical protein
MALEQLPFLLLGRSRRYGSMKAGRRFHFECQPLDRNLMQAFVVPALRNLREERGTRFVGTVKEIKGRATRQHAFVVSTLRKSRTVGQPLRVVMSRVGQPVGALVTRGATGGEPQVLVLLT